jgi:hypothetical protein
MKGKNCGANEIRPEPAFILGGGPQGNDAFLCFDILASKSVVGDDALKTPGQKLVVQRLVFGIHLAQLWNAEHVPDVAIWFLSWNRIKPSLLAKKDVAQAVRRYSSEGKFASTNVIHSPLALRCG